MSNCYQIKSSDVRSHRCYDERTKVSHMQEAALEGVDAHDDLSVMAEALLDHQLIHHLLLDVDVAILQGQHHGLHLLPQILADGCLDSDGAWAADTCLHPKTRCRMIYLKRRAEHSRAQLAIIVVVQLAEDARQRLRRQRALAVHRGCNEFLHKAHAV